VQFAPAGSFLDLQPLEFRKKALYVKEKAVLGRLPFRLVEEPDLHQQAGELLQKHSLTGRFPGQPIRGKDVDPIQVAGCSLIPKPFKARA
jgi:hypothetical protein